MGKINVKDDNQQKFEKSTKYLKLWTVRPRSDFFLLQEQGFFRTDRRFVYDFFLKAYDWMAEQLKKKTPSPKGADLPVWAWYRYGGLNQAKPDLRRNAHLKRGEKGVRIEFEVPENLVLLSNFDAWHAVLNDWCFSINNEEYDYYKKMEKTCPKAVFNEMKWQSWLKIFDLNLLDDPSTDGVQAVLWELKIEWVKKVDFFIAR